MTSSHVAVEIRRGCVDDLLHSPLLVEHWDEVALHKDVMLLAPDELRYRALEQRDNLLVLLAEIEGQVVGYSVTFLTTHMHYSGLLFAQNDILFVARQHRSGSIGGRLIRATEAAAKDAGAELVLWHAKEDSDLDLLLMRRPDYMVQDIIYSKRL